MERGELRERLKIGLRWRSDAGQESLADVTGWWRDPELLQALGPALAEANPKAAPTVVAGPASKGMLLGALVAAHLGVGFVEVRKNPSRAYDSDAWWQRTTPPDYQDRHLRMGFRRDLIRSGDRVLFVDDWIATGGQALTVQALVEDAGASWAGASVIVDSLDDSRARRALQLSSLLHIREL
ncbi:phosphoribosyltransferase family protein [Kineosporia mesophila]|uniref:Phosphoribosyltransferase family protein n=1 Tax=Kineosporia mesophila TaxID=566012 RepID=A0ABP7AFA6_9ACTN|nr:phosphoribosyltransferase family protein [Kineosporia mesophila]MCD5352881.1 hypothetical protein [Kineosporia mesophila]